MKRIAALLLAVMLLLTACAKTPDPTEPSTEATTAPTETTTEATTQPTETTQAPEAQYHNPLTGEPLEEPIMERPYAVVMNNIYDAQPMHGVGQADIFYEYMVDGLSGGITRCLALFTDVGQVEKIGSIRSARTYNISLARSYQALFAHAGGSTMADSLLKSGVVNDLDAGKASSNIFYRDQDRLNSGYALEHTMFTSGEKLMAYAQQLGYHASLPQPYDVGLTFDDDAELKGDRAYEITVRFRSSNGKGSFFTYDAQKGTYTMVQEFYGRHQRDFIDANTDEQVEFRNVMVLHATSTLDSDGYHIYTQLTGEGTGYFARDGKLVSIRWERETEDDPFSYYLEDGTPISLGVGSTYIGIVPPDSPFQYQ